jgi:beta-glucosidase/6-phospho-beta-glucosidase/beta-galactosidase
LNFSSFIMGGFECADHINRSGIRIDLLGDTHHNTRVTEDYAALKAIGITTVREGIRWGFVERAPYDYDFSEVRHRIRAGCQAGIQQCWDLCHFGYPDDMMPTHPLFPARFAALCQAFVLVFREEAGNRPLVTTPINEISFLAWHSGDMRGTVPFATGCGWDIKYHLCKAAIAGVRAIRAIDSEAMIMHVEPLICIHTHPDRPEEALLVQEMNEDQYQAIDIITGRMCPELGGSDDCVDIVGVNYYYANQWEHGGAILPWAPGDDDRLVPLYELLKNVDARYGKPIIISETGHFGEHRPQWIGMIMDQCIKALDLGIDLKGVCIYPVIDRCDWDHKDTYIPCGFVGYCSDGTRTEHDDSVQMLRGWSRHPRLQASAAAQLAIAV